METAIITIGIEKRIDLLSDEGLFTSLHHHFTDELNRNGIPNTLHDNKWVELKNSKPQNITKSELKITEYFIKDLRDKCPMAPDKLLSQGISFSPNKIKACYKKLNNADTGAFFFCYKSAPITLIMKFGDGKLLCAA